MKAQTARATNWHGEPVRREGLPIATGWCVRAVLGRVGEQRRIRVNCCSSEQPRRDLADNSQKELRDVVIEMLDRLNGTAEYDENDELLQQQLNGLTLRGGEPLLGLSRAGRDWLRGHEELLARPY